MNIIKRDLYLQKIIPYIDKQLIKVFTGQRRVGKSFILKQIRNYIVEKNPKANCIFIDKELHQFDDIQDYKNLISYIESKQKSNNNYLFIDEIQEIKNMENALYV